MTNASEIKEEYLFTLVDLNFNSKALINVLTMLAEENIEHCQVIVDAIETRTYNEGTATSNFINMEYKRKLPSELPVEQLSLIKLHEYCHLEIFDFLKLDDSIKLAETCSSLRFFADRTFKKHSNFRLDSRIIKKRNEYIDHVLSNIGKHVSSLDVDCCAAHLDLSKIVEIINPCENVKHLQISNLKIQPCKNIPSVNSFDNVESLPLHRCHTNFMKSFLGNFCKLKSFYLSHCHIKNSKVDRIFQNNPNIDSFAYYNSPNLLSQPFNSQLLELMHNVERLYLHVNVLGTISGLSSLLKLNRLTKLVLHCYNGHNVNNFLKELARKGIVEELELLWFDPDFEFFNILTSFDKLQLLVIQLSSIYLMQSRITWPSKLKQLRLEQFALTKNVEMIQQLQSAESIDIQRCIIVNAVEHFNDVTKLSQLIIDNRQQKKRLHMVLPWILMFSAENRSKQYLFDSEHLRILCGSIFPYSGYNPLGIEIAFPGLSRVKLGS